MRSSASCAEYSYHAMVAQAYLIIVFNTEGSASQSTFSYPKFKWQSIHGPECDSNLVTGTLFTHIQPKCVQNAIRPNSKAWLAQLVKARQSCVHCTVVHTCTCNSGTNTLWACYRLAATCGALHAPWPTLAGAANFSQLQQILVTIAHEALLNQELCWTRIVACSNAYI